MLYRDKHSHIIMFNFIKKQKKETKSGFYEMYCKLKFPDFDTESEELSDIISDLALPDSYIAGYIKSYDEKPNNKSLQGIKSEIEAFRDIKLKLQKIKPSKNDKLKYEKAIEYIDSAIEIGTKIVEKTSS